MLWENLPYTNYENINLDMIIEDMKIIIQHMNELEENLNALTQIVNNHETRITTIEGNITTINNQITEINEILESLDIQEIINQINEINEQITIINQELAEIDIDELIQRINTVNEQSIARDDDLARRIALLEQATINPINQYLGTENLIIYGSDFRNLPEQAIADTELPFGMRYSHSAVDGEDGDAPVKATQYGIGVNSEYVGSGQGYWTLAHIPDMPRSSKTLTTHVTVTFAVASGTSTAQTPTLHSYTISLLDNNIALDWLGGLYLRLNAPASGRPYLVLDIRGGSFASTVASALAGKYITYIRMEYGDASSGLHYNDTDAKLTQAIASYQGQLTPSDVKQIVMDNLEDIIDTQYYEEEYDVVLQPKDGSESYSVPAKIDVRLQSSIGYLSGMIALNIPFDTPTKAVDFTKSFEVTLNTADLDIPAKTVLADTIHSFTDLFTGAQFDAVLYNGEGTIASPSNQICSIRFWGAMKPITLENNGSDFATLGVLKIFEPIEWYLTPPQ